MTYAELAEKIREILPEAIFGEDNESQLIIHTNLMEDGEELIPFVPGPVEGVTQETLFL